MKPNRTLHEICQKWLNATNLPYEELQARAYALRCHRDTNHKYSGHDYEVHLALARDVAERFSNIVPQAERTAVMCGVWGHDVIEDTRQNYNDVRKELGELVAEYVYALTNHKGKNRKERACRDYYFGIRNLKYATFIKLCDRIANVEFNLFYSDGKMMEKYRKEYEEFYNELGVPADYSNAEIYEPMFVYLKELLQPENQPQK